jgi:hypothetical protein
MDFPAIEGYHRGRSSWMTGRVSGRTIGQRGRQAEKMPRLGRLLLPKSPPFDRAGEQ